MKDVMGIVYTGENDALLRELTMVRAIAALPVVGRYRVVDFLVSSMVNGGMRNVGIIMQKNYHSLMDHMGSGKEWDLHGKNEGLYLLPPFLTRENAGVYNSLLDALHSNTNYLERSKQEYVVITGSNFLYNADLNDFVRAHVQSGAEITFMYTKQPSVQRENFGIYAAISEGGEVTDIEVEPVKPNYENTLMNVIVLRRDLLRQLVDKGAAHGQHDFYRDIVLPMVQAANAKIGAWEYTGPAWLIDSVQSYFHFNMDVLDSETRARLFPDNLPVYTKVRDEMPARYGESVQCVNTLVADGCIIEGTVENSILFRGVRIAPGAHVKNCIIMQDGQVHSGAYIENCILDKQAVIKRNARLIGPNAYPIVIAKNVVI